MDKIIQIFTQLGADQSIFYQFAIFIVLFVVLKIVLFNKLLFVLQTRENKTTKMEELANNKFGEAEKLSKQFEEEISKARMTEVEKTSLVKNEALKKIADRKSAKEKEINAVYEQGKQKIEKEFEVTRLTVMENVSTLSTALVEKLTR
jgi:F-type H+-transporting ATPase subunit b